MALPVSTYRFSADDFHRMGKAGIFSEDDRVELLDGEIIEMTPIGSRHAACVDRLTQLFNARLGTTAIVRVQNPIRLDDRSEPQPDVTILQSRIDFYEQAHPGPEDVLLLIEVVDTSGDLDRRVKLSLYAKAGIREVWIVDLEARVIEVHRQASSQGYQVVQQASGVGSLTPEAMPSLTIRVNEVLP